MKKSILLTLLATSSLAFSVLYTQNAQAMTQDPIAAGAAASQNSTLEQSAASTAAEEIENEVRSLPDQVSDFFGSIQNFVANLPETFEGLLSRTIGTLGIPDLKQASDQAEDTPTSEDEATALSEQLENQQDGQGSYAIRNDIADKASRDTALGIANSATLSEQAQQEQAQRAQQAAQLTQQNLQLGQESQSLDVTQQILQNLSQQTALNGQVNHEVLREAQQARIDRAIANTLNAQQARDLSIITTTDRRQGIAAGNAATQQTGLIALPGGYYLGSDSQADLNDND